MGKDKNNSPERSQKLTPAKLIANFNKTKRIRIIILIIWIIITLLLISFFIHKHIAYKKYINDIINSEIAGVVIESEKDSKGFHNLRVKDYFNDTIRNYHLPNNYFFEENNINKMDSVSKPSNNNKLIFYKKINEVYIQCCEYTIAW